MFISRMRLKKIELELGHLRETVAAIERWFIQNGHQFHFVPTRPEHLEIRKAKKK